MLEARPFARVGLTLGHRAGHADITGHVAGDRGGREMIGQRILRLRRSHSTVQHSQLLL